MGVHVLGGNVDVNIQDQWTPALIVNFSKVLGEIPLSANVAIGDRTITVTDGSGVSVGNYISITNLRSNRFMIAYVIAKNVNQLTLDVMVDFAFQAGDSVAYRTTQMAVDGSVTPQIFSVRGTLTQDIELAIDITKIKFTCRSVNAVDLSKFGDLTALVKGIQLRRIDSYVSNVVCVKNNQDFANFGDFTVYSATNPAQGQNGFECEIIFNGLDNLGVVHRIGKNEDLQIVIPENLAGLTSLRCVAFGHVVV